MVHGDEQTERLPFLSQSTQQTWAQVVDVAPGRGKLNMTAQLQEITTWRHRLYLIRCTLRLQTQHYHLRIAGLLPARNKMLGFCRVIDPSCYRMANIPKLLQQAIALLRDDTIVCPLASGREDAYLSLSGVLFVGSTADQRYVLHEHLQNLDLAGPTAPILHWSGHLQKGSHNTHVLPFARWQCSLRSCLPSQYRPLAGLLRRCLFCPFASGKNTDGERPQSLF